ncbi:MAG: Ger(x)C family spore germination protein [Halanaerobiales bacterium]|nr:Ger(x)C family spore germination protein [Halanaerobiales bacterium]
MKKIRKMILFIILFTSIIFLNGCWNYREIDDLAIVLGAAIDINSKDDYIVTVEILNPQTSGKGTEFVPVLFSIEGKSIFDAIRNFVSRTGKKLYWSHTKVIIICEEVARKGIIPVLDFVHRDGEVRSDMWILISKEKTAKEILKSDIKINNSVSFHLEGILKSQISIMKYPKIELWNFIQRFSATGISPILPSTNIIDYNGQKLSQVYGTTIFKGDKMIGFLNGIDTRSMLWITEEDIGGILVQVDEKNGSKSRITYEVFSVERMIKPIYDKGQLTMKIDIKTKLGVGELSKTSPKYYDEGTLKVLEDKIEIYLKDQIKKVIEKVQKEYQSDIFGFGSILQIEMPDVWRKYENNWDEVFSQLQTQIHVEANINTSALIAKPLK